MKNYWRYFFAFQFDRRPNNPRAIHVWAGPLGIHLFWPLSTTQIEWWKAWKEHLP